MKTKDKKPYIALLRGVMPTGKNRIPKMVELQELLSSEFEGVRTYIQSGNIVFLSDKIRNEIAPKVSQLIKEHIGPDLPTVVATRKEVQEMLDNGTTVLEERWIETVSGWRYQTASGILYSAWKEIEGKWYRFDESGYMMAGEWFYGADKWYWLHGDGAMATGWQFINNKWYYFNADGGMYEGFIKYEDKVYYLAPNDGSMISRECRQIEGEWYYFNENGERLEKANIIVDEEGKIQF